MSNSLRPQKSILELGPDFYDEVQPASFPKAILHFRNDIYTERVGLDALDDEEWKNHFCLFQPLPGSIEKPLALRYHGHQFRNYNPDLGDGRGFLFAQLLEKDSNRLLDLGTKGSGKTPYSRGGDGKLTLKGAVREVLATEMLESLGVNTSKTFSVYETGEQLVRHDEPSPTRSAVLVRLSHSHVRYGTFQRLANLNQPENISKLIDYCIRHYYTELQGSENKAAAFLKAVATNAAHLASSWMLAGFVHGVLNTDNMNITGESFDYGPYRFLPQYRPEFTAAYFDQQGLYAFGRQPESVMWSLEQLATALTLVSEPEPLVEALDVYAPTFNDGIAQKFIDRLGLTSNGEKADGELFVAAFDFLVRSETGFEQFFHDWYGGAMSERRALNGPAAENYKGELFEVFKSELSRYKATSDAVNRVQDPEGLLGNVLGDVLKKSRPCTLLIEEIEAIWAEIAEHDNWSVFDKKIHEIRQMGLFYGRRTLGAF